VEVDLDASVAFLIGSFRRPILLMPVLAVLRPTLLAASSAPKMCSRAGTFGRVLERPRAVDRSVRPSRPSCRRRAHGRCPNGGFDADNRCRARWVMAVGPRAGRSSSAVRGQISLRQQSLGDGSRRPVCYMPPG